MTMTATLERNGSGSITVKPLPPSAGASDTALANLTDQTRFEQLQRVARIMGASALTPAHLRGKSPEESIANCFRVVNQAMRWGFDPFAVGDETYVVRGRLGYQGKLIAAVINTRAGLAGRLTATHSGQGDDRTVTISGQFAEEAEPRTVTLSVRQGKTDNEMWRKDPDQKLWYSGVIKWARRHCPEVIMGVLTEDDLERMQVPDAPPALSIDAEILDSRPVDPQPPMTITVPANATFDDNGGEPKIQKLAEGELPNEPATPPTKPSPDADELADNLLASIEQAAKTTELDKIRGEWMRNKDKLGGLADKVKAAWDEKYKAVKGK
jgi:hypothetical protein